MSDSEKTLLKALATFVSLPEAAVDADAVRLLVDRGYAEPFIDIPRGRRYRITSQGRVALADLQESEKQIADQNAQAARDEAAQDIQAQINRQKQYRHDFKVAAFSVILTLLLEHAADVVDLVKRALVAVGLLGK